MIMRNQIFSLKKWKLFWIIQIKLKKNPWTFLTVLGRKKTDMEKFAEHMLLMMPNYYWPQNETNKGLEQ